MILAVMIRFFFHSVAVTLRSLPVSMRLSNFRSRTLSVSDSCPNGSVLPTLYIGKLAKVRLLGLQHLVYTATLAYALTTLFHFIFIY